MSATRAGLAASWLVLAIGCGAPSRSMRDREHPMLGSACTPSPASCPHATRDDVRGFVGTWRPLHTAWTEDDLALFATARVSPPDPVYEDAGGSFHFDGCFVHGTWVLRGNAGAPARDGFDAWELAPTESLPIAGAAAAVDHGVLCIPASAFCVSFEGDGAVSTSGARFRRIAASEATGWERRVAGHCAEEPIARGLPPSVRTVADRELCARFSSAGLATAQLTPWAWHTWEALWLVDPDEGVARAIERTRATGGDPSTIVSDADPSVAIARVRGADTVRLLADTATTIAPCAAE